MLLERGELDVALAVKPRGPAQHEPEAILTTVTVQLLLAPFLDDLHHRKHDIATDHRDECPLALHLLWWSVAEHLHFCISVRLVGALIDLRDLGQRLGVFGHCSSSFSLRPPRASLITTPYHMQPY